MKLRLCAAGLCVVLAHAAIAGDPPKKLKVPTTTASKQPSVSGRRQLEAKLQTPAKLDFGDRKRVTVREVLDQLHEQHQLSLRFDMPTLTTMLDVSSGVPSGYYAPQTAGSYQAGNPTRKMPSASMIPFGAVANLQCLAPIAPVGPYGQIAGAYPPASPAVRASAAQAAPATVNEDDPDEDDSLPPTASAPANIPGRASLPEGLKETEPPPPATHAVEAPPAKPADLQEMLAELLDTAIDIQTLDLSRVSIATALRQALDAAPTNGDEDFSGMPMLLTNAMLLDYLVEDDGLLITSRMKVLTTKETRVYSIKHLSDLPPEQLAKTIRQSIRPWSWRSQINDLGDQLKGTPLPTETLTSILKTGIQLTGAEVSVTPLSTDEGSPEPKKMSAIDEARQMEMLGSAITNGLVTLAQSTLLALEMVHYAEPPTGTIQILGSKLIITQSQAAHREISDLLKQLAEE